MSTVNRFFNLPSRSLRKREGRSARRLSVALLIPFLVCLAPVFAEANNGPDSLEPEQIMPAETFLMLKCSGVDQLQKEAKSLDLFRLWADPEVQAFFADAQNRLPEMLGKKGGEGHQSMLAAALKNVWSLFKGEVALACSSRLTIFEEGMAPCTALTFDMGDRKEAFSSTIHDLLEKVQMNKDLEKGAFDYRGFKIDFIGQPLKLKTICFTKIQNLFVATLNRYYLQDIIDCHLDGKPVLAADPAFNRCLGQVGGKDTDLLLFVGFKPFFKMVQPFWPYEFEEWMGMLGLENVQAACLASSLDEGSSRDSLFIDCPGPKTGLLKALSPHGVSRDNLGIIPADTLYFINLVFDPELIMKEVDKFVRKALPNHYRMFRKEIETAKRESGFDFESEILGPLGSEILFFLNMPKTGVAIIPDMVLMVDLDDAAGFQAFVDKLLQRVGDEVKVGKTSYEGRILRHITPRKPGIPFSPTFTVINSKLFLAGTPMSMKKYLKWLNSGEPGIVETTEFKKAMAGVPDKVTGLEYINLKRCANIGYDLVQPFLPSLLAQSKLPLEPGLLPMTETVTEYFSGQLSYTEFNENGILMTGRSPIGLGALFAAFLSTADYFIEENLLPGILDKANGGAGMKLRKKMVRAADSDSKLETAGSLMENGEYEKAAKLFKAWIDAHPEDPSLVSARLNRGYCLLVLKRYDEAVRSYEYVAKTSEKQRGLALYNITCAYSVTNDKQKALKYLEKAIAAGWNNLDHMESDPDMDNIRDEPEYSALLKRLM